VEDAHHQEDWRVAEVADDVAGDEGGEEYSAETARAAADAGDRGDSAVGEDVGNGRVEVG
jgi:hypothetical protein